MSEWNRRDRDQDDRETERYRPESGSGVRWQDRSGGGQDQTRSFGERGGHGGGGGQGYGSRGYDSGSYGYDQAYGGGDGYLAPGQGYGGQGYGGRGYGGQGYGSEPYGSRGYGGSSYGGSRSGGGQSYREGQSSQSYRGGGQQGIGTNERLQQVADGDAERGHFLGGGMMRGHGEHRGRGPKNYTRSDDRIREDINDRLSDDEWLDASEIDVQVSSCEVTLSGTVSSRDDRRRAEDIAEQVSGVKHVQNNIRVQSAGASSQASGATGTGSVTGASAQQGSATGATRSVQ